MYIYAGYLNNSRLPFQDLSRPLIISSCGIYKLRANEELPTLRPDGREDYQLLYIASGKTYFTFNGKRQLVSSGHMVLFQPRQEQNYEYFGEDKPEVYWIHFTGSDVKYILQQYAIPLDEPVFYAGFSSSFPSLFKKIVNELLTCRIGYQELLTMYFRQILLAAQRTRSEEKSNINAQMQEEIDYARRYFNEHYNEPINIDEYASSRNMSICWFQRNFKKVTNQSPMQYIMNVRMNNAANLLETTNYSMKKISGIVGYENSLYFSRVFKKIIGMTPSEYREAAFEKARKPQ